MKLLKKRESVVAAVVVVVIVVDVAVVVVVPTTAKVLTEKNRFQLLKRNQSKCSESSGEKKTSRKSDIASLLFTCHVSSS